MFEEPIVHVLTKVFLVFAAVLSIGLSALTIAYAVNTDRIAADYNSALASKAVAEAQVATNLAASGERERANAAQLEQLNRDIASRDSQVRQLDAERASLLTEKNKAEAARQSVESKIAELGETTKTQASLIESYTNEVRTLRTNELRYRQQSLDMEDRMSDLESQREVLDQNYRAVQEELAEARRTTDGVRTGTTASADQPFTYAGATITGSVEEVAADGASGGTLVKINVGSNDRVTKNMRFHVIRDNTFVGNLVVVQSDLKWSVARFDDLGRGSAARTGDRVLSRLE